VDAVASFLGVGRDRLLKTLICIADGRPVAALVRGDHTLSTLKLARALGARELALAEEAEVERITGAALGFAGPVGLPPQVDLVADLAVAAMDDAVAGANASDFHLVHVRPGRDFTWRMAADIREAEAGDGCPECGAALQACRGIEVGHVFKLGTKYGEALGATFTDQAGAQVPLQMGCYGIGIGRTAAAIVEAHHDEHGISWPLSVAPYQVLVLPLTKPDSRESSLARELYAELRRLGVETLLDDRDERAGVKFADADLIGIPLRVTVGPRALARGQVELRERATGLERSLGVPEAPREVAAAVARGLLALDPDAG
jgi:prolyl-tRNA synthetase